jgi:histidinol-phosphate aminotransferase
VDAALRLDLAAIADKARGAGLVFLCNPNNPTGTVHGAGAITDFIGQVLRISPTTCILVDEAYHEYVDDPGYRTALPLAVGNPQVIVSRTFSKVYGMAGLRIGYAVGRADTLKAMARFRLGNSVNVLAAAGALAGLSQEAHVARQVALNVEARAFTRRALEAAGFQVVPPAGNFMMVNIRRDAKAFQDACGKKGLMVGRPFPPLTTYSRISVGTLDEMQRAVAIVKDVLAAA